MNIDTCTYIVVYERLCHLPEGLQQAYAPGVYVPFGYEDQVGPPQLLWDLPRLPHVLNDVQQAHLEIYPRGSSSSLHGMPPVGTV